MPSQEEALSIADICPYLSVVPCAATLGASRVVADPALRAVYRPE